MLENFAPQHTDLCTELSQIVTSAVFEGGTGIEGNGEAFRAVPFGASATAAGAVIGTEGMLGEGLIRGKPVRTIAWNLSVGAAFGFVGAGPGLTFVGARIVAGVGGATISTALLK